MQSGLVAGAANGHSQMITCLDGVGGVGGGLLLSGGLDPRLFVWDLRSLARPQARSPHYSPPLPPPPPAPIPRRPRAIPEIFN